MWGCADSSCCGRCARIAPCLILAIAGISAAAVPYLARYVGVYVYAIPALGPLTFSALHTERALEESGHLHAAVPGRDIIIARRNNRDDLEALRLGMRTAGCEICGRRTRACKARWRCSKALSTRPPTDCSFLDGKGRIPRGTRRFLEMWRIRKTSRAGEAGGRWVDGQRPAQGSGTFVKRIEALSAHPETAHSR